MLKIFSDYHHSGLARSLVLALQDRLGHKIYFPGSDFVEKTLPLSGGHSILLTCLPSWTLSLGGFPDSLSGEWKQNVTYEQFMDTQWDVFMVTRIETQHMFRKLKELHPNGANIKIICQTGNDGTSFEWDFCKNFMASDEASYRRAPADVHSIWYMQELGRQYMSQEFVPLDDVSLKSISCFVNCWPTFNAVWRWDKDRSAYGGGCPHCGSAEGVCGEPVSPYGIWEQAKAAMPDHTFLEYGIACTLGCIPEVCLPLEYTKSGITVHMKTYDGYGHSMLQAIACGRPVIVPKGFHRYRTAGRVLVPNLTCFEADWNAQSLIDTLKAYTSDLDTANEYAYGCWKAARGLFNFGLEAKRLEKFMDNLI